MTLSPRAVFSLIHFCRMRASPLGGFSISNTSLPLSDRHSPNFGAWLLPPANCANSFFACEFIRKNSQAKKELAQLAGGSNQAPKFGECRSDSGKLVFEMEKPPSGLARILQKWIKENTALGLKVMVGTESAEDEDQPMAAQ